MTEKIILKSVYPEQYPDLEVECRVIQNNEIGGYLDSIPEENKFVGYKKGMVTARNGIPGEVIKTVLKTVIDGKEYILHEEETTVKERTYLKKILVSGNVEKYAVKNVDVVVTNIYSISNEEYVIKHEEFVKKYNFLSDRIHIRRGFASRWGPVYKPKVLTQVDENVIIVTAWGSKAVCLKGSYIVTNDASTNDYSALEKGTFESTYAIEKGKVKRLKQK